MPESRLWLEGRTTLGGFACRAGELYGLADLDGADQTTADASGRVVLRTAEVAVPVLGLHCGKRPMDASMYRTLRAEQAPEIRYRLVAYQVKPGASGDEFTVHTRGELSIAGTTREITLDVIARALPGGAFRVEGRREILMTDYGMKPPTVLMGAVRADNRIVVKFDLVVDRAQLLATATAANAAVADR
jgi:polyisoprenoid-binding protein YceI